jgi:hypothetical protein
VGTYSKFDKQQDVAMIYSKTEAVAQLWRYFEGDILTGNSIPRWKNLPTRSS